MPTNLPNKPETAHPAYEPNKEITPQSPPEVQKDTQHTVPEQPGPPREIPPQR